MSQLQSSSSLPSTSSTNQSSQHFDSDDSSSVPPPMPAQSLQSVAALGQSKTASSATRLQTLLQSIPLFHCPVSSLPYEFSGPKTPRSLRQCGHTFSEEVLLSLRGASNSVVCPLCHTETHLDAPDKDAFHTNKPLLETLKVLHEQNAASAKAPKCEGCTSPAVYRCVDCEALLCSSCFPKNHSVGLLKSHRPVPFTGDVLRSDIFCNRCPEHPKYFNEFVCLDPSCAGFKRIFCPMCERLSHKNHPTECIAAAAASARKQLDEQLKALQSRLDKSTSVLIRVLDTSRGISPDVEEDSDHEPSDGSHGTEKAAIQFIHEFFDDLRSRLAAREQKLVEAVSGLAQKKKSELHGQAEEISDFLSSGYQAVMAATLLLQRSDDSEFMSKVGDASAGITQVDQRQFMMIPRVSDLLNISIDANFHRHIEMLGRVEDDGVLSQQSYYDSSHHLVIPIPTRAAPPADDTEEAYLQTSDSSDQPAPAVQPSIRFHRWSDKLVVTNDYRTVSKHAIGKKSNMFCTPPSSNTYSVRVDDLPSAGNNWVIGWADPAFPLDGWERGVPCAIMAAYDGVPYSSGGVLKLPIRHSSIQAPFSLQKGSIVHTTYDEEHRTVSFAINDEPPQVLLSNVTGNLHPFLRIHSVGVVLTLI